MAHELLMSLAVSGIIVYTLPSPFLILIFTALIVDSTTARQMVITLGKWYEHYEKNYQQTLQVQKSQQDQDVTPPEEASSQRFLSLVGRARRLSWSMLSRRTL